MDTILKGTHPGTIPARFGLIWFSSFRGDLNVICYQNMSNLYNRYKSAERNISQKKTEYMLNYSLPCSCSYDVGWMDGRRLTTDDRRQVMAIAHVAFGKVS